MNKKIIGYTLLFVVANIALFFLHIWLFQSPMPQLSWLSILAHLFGLILFPYTKFYSKINKNK